MAQKLNDLFCASCAFLRPSQPTDLVAALPRQAFLRLGQLLFWPQKSAEGARTEPMKDPLFQLCDQIRETSFALHRHLRHGHVEKVYENGLAHRLRKQAMSVIQQHSLSVFDEDGTLLGDFSPDLFVENQLIVELKAVRKLADEHVAQLLGYLRASRIEHGLLINFGAPVLEIRKYVLSDAA